jgi:hypothetical protein
MTHAEDFDFWVRLLMLGGHARYINGVLADYRVRAGSASARPGRMLMGNIRTYEKAVAALQGQPEGETSARLLEQNRRALTVEQAIDRVIGGDTRGGLAELRRAGPLGEGWAWRVAAFAWRIVPPLARPMLAWRRQAHARGNTRTRRPPFTRIRTR